MLKICFGEATISYCTGFNLDAAYYDLIRSEATDDRNLKVNPSQAAH